MSVHRGSCHCGAVRLEVETDLSDPFRCSFCIRRGAVLQKVPAEKVRVIDGRDDLVRYGTRDFSKHFFCVRCGIHTFTEITREAERSVAVNLACLEDVELDGLSPRLFDGARLL